MAEKRTIELEIQDNSKTLKQQYKEAVVELQKVAAAYGETSQQAAEAAKKAAGLKDRIEDTNDAIKAFKGEGAFNALGKSVNSVASGFSAVEGAMGLVGVESEKLQETMLRVQSAMALAQGLEGLEDAGRAFKQLGAVAMNALKGIKGALAATGIGLFVVALGTVVAYWDEIKEAVSGVSAEQAKLNEETHKNFETSKEQLSTLDAQDNVLKLQGKSERQILNIKIAQINATIEKGKIELENVIRTSKAEEEAAIKNYNLTKSIVNLIIDTALFLPKLMIKPIDLAIQGANKVSEALGLGKLISFDLGKTIEGLEDKAAGFVAGSLFNVEDVKAEGEKTRKGIEKELKDLENQKAGFQLSIKAIDKQAVEDSKKNQEDALNEEERKQKEHQEKYLNEDRLQTKSVLDASNQRILQVKAETEEQRKQNEIRVQSNKEYLDKIQSQEQAAYQHKLALQQQGLDVALQGVQLIASVFEKQKGVQKAAVIAESAIGIAKMIIANKLANAGALATPQAIATSGAAAAPVIAMNNISTGIGIAANIAATAKALKTLGGGSAPSSPPLGGGGGTGGGGAMAPQFNTIGSSGINQLATLQQQPVQAYVVSGEVTSAQSLDRNRVQNATL
jgi:hypothetical protein